MEHKPSICEQQYAAELKRLSQAQTLFASDVIDEQVDIQHVFEGVYALETQHEELRRAEQICLDEAIALSLNDVEVAMLLGHPPTDFSDSDSDVVIIDTAVLECKPAPSCTCCLTELVDTSTRRPLPCGHLYCLQCIMTRAGMGVRDRNLLPAHCCRKEFPIEYVKEALSPTDFAQYERFLSEKHWTTLDLDSDREYASSAKHHGCVQCPGCGVGVQRISGCNRMRCHNSHEFCFDCGKAWKTCPCRYYP